MAHIQVKVGSTEKSKTITNFLLSLQFSFQSFLCKNKGTQFPMWIATSKKLTIRDLCSNEIVDFTSKNNTQMLILLTSNDIFGWATKGGNFAISHWILPKHQKV